MVTVQDIDFVKKGDLLVYTSRLQKDILLVVILNKTPDFDELVVLKLSTGDKFFLTKDFFEKYGFKLKHITTNQSKQE